MPAVDCDGSVTGSWIGALPVSLVGFHDHHNFRRCVEPAAHCEVSDDLDLIFPQGLILCGEIPRRIWVGAQVLDEVQKLSALYASFREVFQYADMREVYLSSSLRSNSSMVSQWLGSRLLSVALRLSWWTKSAVWRMESRKAITSVCSSSETEEMPRLISSTPIGDPTTPGAGSKHTRECGGKAVPQRFRV